MDRLHRLRASMAHLDACSSDAPDRAGLLIQILEACSALFTLTKDVTYLRHIIDYTRASCDVIPGHDPEWERILWSLAETGAFLQDEQLRRAADDVVDQTIKLFKRSLASGGHGDVEQGQLHNNLGVALTITQDLTLTDSLTSLDLSIEHFRTSANLLPRSHDSRRRVLSKLESVYWVRFDRSGSLKDWKDSHRWYLESIQQTESVLDPALTLAEQRMQEAELHFQATLASDVKVEMRDVRMEAKRILARFRDALAALPSADRTRRLCCASRIGSLCAQLHRLSGSWFTLNLGITQVQSVVSSAEQATGEQVDHMIQCLEFLSFGYGVKFDESEDISDLESSAGYLTDTRDLVVRSKREPTDGMLHRLGMLHSTLYERRGREEDLETAIILGQEALAAAQSSGLETVEYWSNLGWLYKVKAYPTQSVQYIDKAIESSMEAYRLASEEQVIWDTTMVELLDCLSAKCLWSSQVQDYEVALKWSREFLPHIPADHPDRIMALSTIHSLKKALKERAGRDEDAVSARDTVGDEDDDEVEHATNQATLHRMFHLEAIASRGMAQLRQGNEQEIIRAISALTELLESTGPRDRARGPRLTELGWLKVTLFLDFGRFIGLREAFLCFRAALKLVAFLSPVRVEALHGLAEAYRFRYLTYDAAADLGRAIDLLEEVLRMPMITNQRRAHCYVSLGETYMGRYEREQNEEYLTRSLEMREKAHGCLPAGDLSLQPISSAYADFKYARYCASGRLSLLDEAVQDIREAISLMPSNNFIHPWLLRKLGILLRARFDRVQEVQDLDDATSQLTDALGRVSTRGHFCADVLLRLCETRITKYKLDKCPKHLERCLEDGQRVLGMACDLSGEFLMRAHWGLVCTLCLSGDFPTAARLVQKMVPLMMKLIPHFLEVSDKTFVLGKLSEWASGMTAVSLLGGADLYDALMVLEAGRGLLMTSLDQLRAPVTELYESNPRLADDLDSCRTVMERSSSGSEGQGRDLAPVRSRYHTDERYEANITLEQSITAIKEIPGFENFLLPCTQDEMQVMSASAPIVVINVSDFSCHAITIQEAGLSRVPLRGLHLRDISRHETKLHSFGLTTQLLQWLWDVIAEPILDHLRIEAPPPDGTPWPRVRWVPTGRLSRFPIHAAGYHGRQGCSVIDRVVSSYSFSVASLMRDSSVSTAGETRIPAKSMRVSVVGAGSLKYVPEEVSRISQLWQGGQVRQVEPRTTQVLESIKDCDIFHFAGHGHTATDPLNSALVLQEGDRLAISDLLKVDVRTRKPFLAYLSACGTSRIQQARMLSEGLHLVASFQLSGFRHVLGTLWDVMDNICVDIAADTYSWMQSHGQDDRSVAEGLHNAVRKQRAAWMAVHHARISKKARSKDRSKPEHLHPRALPAEPPIEKPQAVFLDGIRPFRMTECKFINSHEESPRQDGGNRDVTDDVDDESDDDDGRPMPCDWVPYVHFGV